MLSQMKDAFDMIPLEECENLFGQIKALILIMIPKLMRMKNNPQEEHLDEQDYNSLDVCENALWPNKGFDLNTDFQYDVDEEHPTRRTY